ncbi:MAG: hypothetical protein FWH10_00050 [Oscillospiraceae bacterium]|nr:hypothetical protein [Oscillospiraceae bacterium]
MEKKILGAVILVVLVVFSCFPAYASAQDGGFISVSAGYEHSAATKSDGSVWIWGANRYIEKIAEENVSQVYAGGQSTIIIKDDGSLWWLWWYDDSGPIMTDVIQVSTQGIYSHTMAIKSDGGLWAWGTNSGYELGDGTNEARDESNPVKIMDDVIQVSIQSGTSAAIKSDGSLWAWGWNISRSGPLKIMDDVIQVSAGNGYLMAIKNDGSLWAWGANFYGQLGDGTTKWKLGEEEPVKIMDDVIQVSARNTHTAAIKSDGSLWVWGDNEYGQIGDGTRTKYDYSLGTIIIAENNNRLSPVKIMDGVIQVAVGDTRTMAITSDGSLWAWGDNRKRLLGDGTAITRLSPVKVTVIESELELTEAEPPEIPEAEEISVSPKTGDNTTILFAVIFMTNAAPVIFVLYKKLKIDNNIKIN